MKYKITILLSFLLSFGLNAQNLTGIKICVNPGHGGYDSDDRNVVIAPYTSGDPNGFWESQSNLDKGLQLREMLEAAGATVIMTRVTNTTADDLPLSQIVAMGNQANVDFLLSIHSNAGNGVANHVLMLHAGVDLNDNTVYNTFDPNNPAHKLLSDNSRAISTEIAKNLYANQITTWSSTYSVRGEKTFARTAMGWSDGYGVMRGLYVPGVISEGMMHDYIPEAYRLMNMEYKWLEAWNFYKTFCTYYNAGQIPTGNIAGQVRDSRLSLETSYNKFAGNDRLLPLNGAKLTLIETGETYTVDQLQNGVFVFKNLAPGVYHVKAELDKYYSQIAEITVTANNVAYMNFGLNRVRNTAPQVVSYSPQVELTDSVDASTDIVLNFNWDMDVVSTSAAFSITPHVDGKITYEDSQYRLRFTPDKPLDKSTVYTVKLAKSASHPDNLSMTEDFSFRFMTKNRNRLSLITSNPFSANNGVHYQTPSFRLIFDRKLNTTNLQTKVNVLDENGTVLGKNSRSFVNNSIMAPYGSIYFSLSANLVAGKEYTLVVNGDLADEIGMKVVEPVEIKFKAVNAMITNQPVVNTFEALNYVYDATQSSEAGAATAATSTTKLFGSYSNKLTAPLSSVASYATFKANAPVTVTSDKVIGLHLYGDLSGAEVQLQFTAGDELKYVHLCDLNFFGWEFHEAKLNALTAGTDYQLTGIRIVRKNDWLFAAQSEIFIDNMLLYSAPLSAVNDPAYAALKVYPNPVSDIVRVAGLDAETPVLQLYTLNGAFLKTVNSKELNVSDIGAGTYLLKINLKNTSIHRPVIIVR